MLDCYFDSIGSIRLQLDLHNFDCYFQLSRALSCSCFSFDFRYHAYAVVCCDVLCCVGFLLVGQFTIVVSFLFPPLNFPLVVVVFLFLFLFLLLIESLLKLVRPNWSDILLFFDTP